MNAVELIKQSINRDVIINILNKLGKLKIFDNGTDTIRTSCPIHGGDNPTAFSWNYNNGLWFCFTGCHDGGDIFDFVAKTNNLDSEKEFRRIVFLTAELCDLDITGLELGEAKNRNVKELREWIMFMENKCKKYEFEQFDLNTMGELKEINKYRSFDRDICKRFEACYSPLINRIVIPIYHNNMLVGVSTRRVSNAQTQKWIHYPSGIKLSNTFYNIDYMIENNLDTVIIVEGMFDVWNLYKLGIFNAVACFGTHLTSQQEDIIVRHFPNVILGFDNDNAGIDCTKKCIEKLKNKCNLKCMELGSYNDPGEIKSIDEVNIIPWYAWLHNH